MNALEARTKALDIQKNRWSKLPLEVRTAIQEATSCGQLHCVVDAKIVDMDLFNLRALGYNVRDIVEDTFEISW